MKQAEVNTKIDLIDLKEDFDKIYLLYFPRILRFAKEYVITNEEAENIVQDVFTLLWEKKSTLTIHTSLACYLFTLTKYKALDYLRHKIVEDTFNQEYRFKLSAIEQINYAFSTEQELEQLINNALEKLPEKCRLIFLKSRFEGKKYREIAEELNISVNTVENQMGIALKRLRTELKDYLPILLFFV